MQLDSIRVVDLTRLLPGPYATQLLSDMGAEVIKIEDPDLGDYARFIEPKVADDVGAVFSAINRGKKSVTINLKDEGGLEAFYKIVADADAVIEQFRPGVAARLGVDYESVRIHNPDIVYCSLSGYGQDGNYRDRVGHDLNYASMAGLIDMTRDSEGSKPEIPGFLIGDIAGGTFTALSMVSALLSRELNKGDSNYIDLSITDTLLSFSHAVAPLALNGDQPRPGRTELTGKFPCYDVYETADGRYLSIGALEPKFWRTLCEELGQEELIERHRAEDEATRVAVRERLAETFRSKTLEEWKSRLAQKEVMFAPVQTISEAVTDDHVRSRGIVRDANGLIPRIGYPAKVRHGLQQTDESVPEMGEHTEEVLEEAGIDQTEFEELRRQDVV
ncbi:CaiB/BaiF CoA transferase family protein [Natrinema halophilum]|uniref:CaiB/BaiF CoA transferase family protein n=1 Tax=Natrinema halophilum TaxID=1699371 RepID=UPI001F1A3619|nr:CaiB/BaiF CoA-transferase family protein [Natrinema halophilum]UHQ96206.1 CoA transferase [Natrinema halophilum]